MKSATIALPHHALQCPPLTDCVEKVPDEQFGAVSAQQ
jgi:hypothetical protein